MVDFVNEVLQGMCGTQAAKQYTNNSGKKALTARNMTKQKTTLSFFTEGMLKEKIEEDDKMTEYFTEHGYTEADIHIGIDYYFRHSRHSRI